MAIRDNNPCFGCEHRRVGCHISCAQHLKWCKQQEERKEMITKCEGFLIIVRKEISNA